jgi:hexokinase
MLVYLFLNSISNPDITILPSVHLIDHLIILNGYSTPGLNKHYGFDTALMSDLEKADPHTPEFFSRARAVFVDQLGFKNDTVANVDLEIARWACQVVATRAARLSAVGIAAVVKKTGVAEKEGTIQVGVDGR